jgi:hypothetical protein
LKSRTVPFQIRDTIASTELSITDSRNSLVCRSSTAVWRSSVTSRKVKRMASSSCSTELKLTLAVTVRTVAFGQVQVDPARVDHRRRKPRIKRPASSRWGAEQRFERAGGELRLGGPDDLPGARIGEQHAPVAVDHDHAVGGALEEAGVALEELHALLGFDAAPSCSAPSRRAATAEGARCERDGRRVRERRRQRQLGVAERWSALWTAGTARRAVALVVHDGKSASEAKPRAGSRWRTTSSSGLSAAF